MKNHKIEKKKYFFEHSQNFSPHERCGKSESRRKTAPLAVEDSFPPVRLPRERENNAPVEENIRQSTTCAAVSVLRNVLCSTAEHKTLGMHFSLCSLFVFRNDVIGSSAFA